MMLSFACTSLPIGSRAVSHIRGAVSKPPRFPAFSRDLQHLRPRGRLDRRTELRTVGADHGHDERDAHRRPHEHEVRAAGLAANPNVGHVARDWAFRCIRQPVHLHSSDEVRVLAFLAHRSPVPPQLLHFTVTTLCVAPRITTPLPSQMLQGKPSTAADASLTATTSRLISKATIGDERFASSARRFPALSSVL